MHIQTHRYIFICHMHHTHTHTYMDGKNSEYTDSVCWGITDNKHSDTVTIKSFTITDFSAHASATMEKIDNYILKSYTKISFILSFLFAGNVLVNE